MLKDVFGFAESQQKATFGLGSILTVKRNKDEAVRDKARGIDDARIKIDYIHWYLPHYTPSIQQEGILSTQTSNRTPKELRYIERSVFMKQVKKQKLCNFELCSQGSINVTIWIIVAFQQRDRQDSQNSNNDFFIGCLLPVLNVFLGLKNILMLAYY